MSVYVNSEDNCSPSTIRQGERSEWTVSYGDYPTTEYTLQYRFRGNGPGINVDAVVVDGKFVAELTAAQSATMAVTKYIWQAWLTEIADSTNTFIVNEGFATVQAGFTAASLAAIDPRSPAQIALDTINAALLAFATSDITEYEISTPAGSRRVKRSDKAQLLSMRKEFAMTVSMERTRSRIKNGGSLIKSVPITVRGS